jgi:hypothetical protein
MFTAMSVAWTTAQVLALSPDEKSAQNGKGLANPSKWQTLGTTQTTTWGECRGSGKQPYQTQIDLTEPAFRCSCPSRKFPCKHALGLFLLLTGQPTAFTEDSPPDWVQDWLAKRSQATQKKQAQQEQPKATVDPAAQAQRLQKREAKVQAGLADLDRWLRDFIRQGLANAPSLPYSFWDHPAARMVDAQAPALARRLRELASLPHAGKDWPSRLLAELGLLHLLIQGYQRQESLSPSVQAEVRSQVGWTIQQEDLLTAAHQAGSEIETLHDTWAVLGMRISTEENLRLQRVWLQGQTGRFAVILSFTHGSSPLETSLVPGTALEATLVFYPGLYPLRALVQNRGDALPLSCPSSAIAMAVDVDQALPVGRSVTIASGITAYGHAMAQNPWLTDCPLFLDEVIPCPQASGWVLKDCEGNQLPLRPQFTQTWELLALSGGQPLRLFGEWDGRSLLPLSMWLDDQIIAW